MHIPEHARAGPSKRGVVIKVERMFLMICTR